MIKKAFIILVSIFSLILSEKVIGLEKPSGLLDRYNICSFSNGRSSFKALNLTQFMALEAMGAIILDTRHEDEFIAGYIPKSIHIGWNGPFKTWVPKILVDKDQLIILVADSSSVVQQANELVELGYTNVLGYLAGGIDEYQKQYVTDRVTEISAAAYYDLSTQGQIIDVRSQKEYSEEHIDNAMNFPLQDLSNFSFNLPENKNYYIQCLSGYRSLIALSILKFKGVEHVIQIRGGYQSLKKIKEEK